MPGKASAENLKLANAKRKENARLRKIERAKELLAEEDAKNAQQMTDEEKLDSNTKKQLAKDMIDGRDCERSDESSEEEVEQEFVDIVARRVAGMKIKKARKAKAKARKNRSPKKEVVRSLQG